MAFARCCTSSREANKLMADREQAGAGEPLIDAPFEPTQGLQDRFDIEGSIGHSCVVKIVGRKLDSVEIFDLALRTTRSTSDRDSIMPRLLHSRNKCLGLRKNHRLTCVGASKFRHRIHGIEAE